MKINSFDIDGVIYLGDLGGVYPGPNDVIITGRSYEEKPETISMLKSKGIHNQVFFNPLKFDDKTRKSSGIHKGNTLKKLLSQGMNILVHWEDDPVQIEEIKKIVPEISVIYVCHNLVEKENVRHI